MHCSECQNRREDCGNGVCAILMDFRGRTWLVREQLFSFIMEIGAPLARAREAMYCMG